MEKRLTLRTSIDDDSYRRRSFQSSTRPSERASVAFSSRDVVTPSTGSRGEPENVFDTPPGSPALESENVFGTPTSSRPSSINISLTDTAEFSAPSIRSSSILSDPRSLSPIPVADGWSYHPVGHHRRSISGSRSETPTLTGPGAGGLQRSNTTTTHNTSTSNTSTLYSISNLSELSDPPSPIHSVAPVRPQFDYGGHQQTLSINGSELDDADPFGDSFEMPVGDGFAPHSQRPPISSAASHISHTGSFGSLPPPYTQYPGHISPKPEDDEVDLGAARPFASQLDPGASMGDGEARRRRSRRVVAGAVVEVPDADAVSVGGGSDPHANDESGAVKEWKDKRLFGGRLWVIILAGLAALLVGIAVGLGVGLGIGLQKAKAAASSSIATTTTNYQPSPENTSPPTSEPNNLYPDIPTGKTAISPLKLKAFNNECKISSNKSSTPDIFSQGSNGLWSCNIPNQKPLMWDVLDWPASLASAQLSKLGTVPPTLTCAQWEGGLWGGYLISSVEGEYQQDQKNTVYITQDNQTVLYASSRFREGLQDPAFYRQPLAFLNVTWQPDPSVPNRKRDAGTINSLSYNFGTLYNKTVILKESTMIETFNSRGSNPGRYGNGSEFVAGDKVWMCTWEKTLLEVEIMVNEHSLAVTNKGNTAHAADSRKTYNDDDNGTTTITVSANTGTVSFPPPFRSSSASTSQPSGTFSFPASPTVPHGHHPRPPPPPPPPPSPSPQPPRPPSETDVTVVVSEDFEFVGDMRRIRQKRDGSSPGNGPRCYPKKVKIKEYRPTPNRLRQVLGIDLTDADPTGQGIPGRVYCRKFIAQDDGGLQAYPSKRGEVVEVELKEDYVFTSTNAGSGSRKRQSGPNSTTTDDDEDGLDDDSSMKCLCNWHS